MSQSRWSGFVFCLGWSLTLATAGATQTEPTDYVERIIVCEAFTIADRFIDYPLEIPPHYEMTFSVEFGRLTPTEPAEEVVYMDEFEDTIRSIMFVFNSETVMADQRETVFQNLIDVCDQTLADVPPNGE